MLEIIQNNSRGSVSFYFTFKIRKIASNFAIRKCEKGETQKEICSTLF